MVPKISSSEYRLKNYDTEQQGTGYGDGSRRKVLTLLSLNPKYLQKSRANWDICIILTLERGRQENPLVLLDSLANG